MSLTEEAAVVASNEQDDFKEISERNSQKIQNKAAKLGYADGIAAGRDSVFQNGFDCGYADGLRTGFELEKFKSFYGQKSKDDRLQQEKSIYEAMKMPDSKDKTHFQYSNYEAENLETISKQQHTYIDEQLEKYRSNLPLATDMLSKK